MSWCYCLWWWNIPNFYPAGEVTVNYFKMHIQNQTKKNWFNAMDTFSYSVYCVFLLTAWPRWHTDDCLQWWTRPAEVNVSCWPLHYTYIISELTVLLILALFFYMYDHFTVGLWEFSNGPFTLARTLQCCRVLQRMSGIQTPGKNKL